MTPIRDPSRYPPDWSEIRARILERAGHKCEGSPAYPECRADNGRPHPVTGSIVVLTVAHLDYSSHDDENLRAWCQRCHLTYDAKENASQAARTRQRELEEAGQERLFDSGCGPETSDSGEFMRYADHLAALKTTLATTYEDVLSRDRQITELQEDIDTAKGDLNECASHLGIELLGAGLTARIHGLTLAVKGKVADARREALDEYTKLPIPQARIHSLFCKSGWRINLTDGEKEAYKQGWKDCIAKLEGEKGG